MILSIGACKILAELPHVAAISSSPRDRGSFGRWLEPDRYPNDIQLITLVCWYSKIKGLLKVSA